MLSRGFLQETYSTKEIENQWKMKWQGEIFFAHGSAHGRGDAIFIRDKRDFNLKSVETDMEGRFIFLDCSIQDDLFL